LFAVIGRPVGHSLSPALHNAAFEALGLDAVMVAVDPGEDLEKALAAFSSAGIRGISVTMPFKEAAFRLSRPSGDAEWLMAVNALVLTEAGGPYAGHNVDGAGFVEGLRHEGGEDVAGAVVAVLGAGGAARAVALACARAGAAEIRIVGRTPANVERAVSLLRHAAPEAKAIPAAPEEAIAGAHVLVNATPVGMDGTPYHGAMPVDPSLIRPSMVVVDLVYHPRHTPLVKEAASRGAKALNGLPMLVHQACLAFSLFTGAEAPVAAMHRAVGL
jgi:shikimate dehydrogenase